jgi:L-threonylcarbamoyladenylate synthase
LQQDQVRESSEQAACKRARIFKRMPAHADAAAQVLFAALREFDLAGATQIWVEAPPTGPNWDGVRDRLQRAAA